MTPIELELATTRGVTQCCDFDGWRSAPCRKRYLARERIGWYPARVMAVSLEAIRRAGQSLFSPSEVITAMLYVTLVTGYGDAPYC
jgi:hypothetical protein